MNHPQNTPLTSSLSSLRASTSLLNSSLKILDQGTSDLPRLQTVLQQTRHFELVPTSSLQSAQDAVLRELVPEVERLLNRAEAVIERRERREEWLRARWALGEGRLGRGEGSMGAEVHDVPAAAKKDRAGGAGAGGDEVKARRLRQKKERLSYAVERLTLQASQRERQLRVSMAAQGVKGVGADASAGGGGDGGGEEEW